MKKPARLVGRHLRRCIQCDETFIGQRAAIACAICTMKAKSKSKRKAAS